MATVFALVNIPKAQQKGAACRKTAEPGVYPYTMPKYLTELAVTQAIVEGKENGFGASQLYEEAKRYQKWFKEQSRPKFFKKTAAAKPNTHVNFRPGYATK